jgi:hypothetical protein
MRTWWVVSSPPGRRVTDTSWWRRFPFCWRYQFFILESVQSVTCQDLFPEKSLFPCFSFALLAFPVIFSQNKAHPFKYIHVPGLLVASDHMKVVDTVCYCMHQCCGSGSEIRCLLTPGSGIRDG